MRRHERLLERARSLGLANKIDPDEVAEDQEYMRRWDKVLDTLWRAREYLPDLGPVASSLDEVGDDVRAFFGERARWREFLDGLHEDSDPEAEYLAALRARNATRAACSTGAAAGAGGSEIRAGKLRGTMFVSDVDWEDHPGGARAFVYGRDADDRDETTLLVCELRDYFYIELVPRGAAGAGGGPPDMDGALRELRRAETGLQQRYARAARDAAAERSQRRRIPPADATPTEDEAGRSGPARLQSTFRGGALLGGPRAALMLDTQVVRDLRSVYGYRRNPGLFMRVLTASPTVTRDLFGSLGRKFPGWRFFEADVDPLAKFMVERGFSGCMAVDYAGTRVSHNALSTCRRLVSQVSALGPSQRNDVAVYAPRNLYFDIECMSPDRDVFPTADRCPVIQISYVVTDGTDEALAPLARGVLCLKETTGAAHYESFDSEEEVLIRFAKLLRRWSPDFLVGYNSNSFDLPYVLDRMDALDLPFARELSRRRGALVRYMRGTSFTNQAGARSVTSFLTPGLTLFDQLAVLQADGGLRLRGYSLKAVCEHFLRDGDNKEDLRYREIPVLFAEGPAGRGRIASYCLKDSELLVRLDRVVSLGFKASGMAVVLGTTAKVVLTRGLVFKLISKVLSYTRASGFIVPSFTREQRPAVETGYQGAFVVEPVRGLHEDPVVVCDAASLYPSCMRCDNLSWDTLSLDAADRAEHPGDYVQLVDDWFVRKEIHEGLLVRLQADLARERKAAKKRRDACPEGSDAWNVHESVQLGTKIAMNSIYGMLGSPTCPVPLVQVAKTITGRGRHMLNMFKTFVEASYARVTGQPPDAPVQIVYGDSVRGDMPVVVRRNRRTVHVVLIEDLVLLTATGVYGARAHHGTKQAADLTAAANGGVLLEAWTERGWTRITAVVRHLHHEPLVRVSTKFSSVVVTRHHSLVEHGTLREIRPEHVIPGRTRLLHSPFQSPRAGAQLQAGFVDLTREDDSEDEADCEMDWRGRRCDREQITASDSDASDTDWPPGEFDFAGGPKRAALGREGECCGRCRACHARARVFCSGGNGIVLEEHSVQLAGMIVALSTWSSGDGERGISFELDNLCAHTAARLRTLLDHYYPDLRWTQHVSRHFDANGYKLGVGAAEMPVPPAEGDVVAGAAATPLPPPLQLPRPGIRLHGDPADAPRASRAARFVLVPTNASRGFFESWFEFVFCWVSSRRAISPFVFGLRDAGLRRGFIDAVTTFYPDWRHDATIFQGIYVLLDGLASEDSALEATRRADDNVVFEVAVEPRNPRGGPVNNVHQPVWVYDLTTENHHFQAGAGNMIVHNTDSIFVKMPGTTVARAIEYGGMLEVAFRKEQLVGMEPHNFEYEKTFAPLMLCAKKRYVGRMHELDPKKAKLKAMGVQLVRRDSAVLCLRAMQGFFDRFLMQNDRDGAVAHVEALLADMFAGRLPLEDFEITKKIGRTEYSGDKPAFVQAWEHMRDQLGASEADLVPSVGERFSYVVTVPERPFTGGARGTHRAVTEAGRRQQHARRGMADAILGMPLARREPHLRLDYNYYCRTFVDNPLRPFLQFFLPRDRVAAVLSPQSYSCKTVVKASRGNILGFFGASTFTVRKRKHVELRPAEARGDDGDDGGADDAGDATDSEPAASSAPSSAPVEKNAPAPSEGAEKSKET